MASSNGQPVVFWVAVVIRSFATEMTRMISIQGIINMLYIHMCAAFNKATATELGGQFILIFTFSDANPWYSALNINKIGNVMCDKEKVRFFNSHFQMQFF